MSRLPILDFVLFCLAAAGARPEQTVERPMRPGVVVRALTLEVDSHPAPFSIKRLVTFAAFASFNRYTGTPNDRGNYASRCRRKLSPGRRGRRPTLLLSLQSRRPIAEARTTPGTKLK
jgi:hypothetical protein